MSQPGKNRYPITKETQTALSAYPSKDCDTGEKKIILRRHQSVQTVILFGLEENKPEFLEMLEYVDSITIQHDAKKIFRSKKEKINIQWKTITDISGHSVRHHITEGRVEFHVFEAAVIRRNTNNQRNSRQSLEFFNYEEPD